MKRRGFLGALTGVAIAPTIAFRGVGEAERTHGWLLQPLNADKKPWFWMGALNKNCVLIEDGLVELTASWPVTELREPPVYLRATYAPLGVSVTTETKETRLVAPGTMTMIQRIVIG